MDREVAIVKDGVVVWQGIVKGGSGQPSSSHDSFAEAWKRAVKEGAVSEADMGALQFRFVRR